VQVPQADIAKSPYSLSQRVPAGAFQAETEMDFNPASMATEAGLAIFGIDCLQNGLASWTGKDGARKRVLAIKKNAVELCAVPCPPGRLHLVLDFSFGGACRFGLRAEAARIDWVGPSMQARKGDWVGARVGLYCVSGGPFPTADYADFDFFRFSPPGK